MRRPHTVAGWLAVTLVTGVIVAGGAAVARTVFGCGTRHEAGVVARWKADPFFAIAPPDGTRIAERSQPGACAAGVTVVSRTYLTPAVYGFDRLHQVFDQPALAAGWKPETDGSDAGGPGNPPSLTYCKRTGDLVSIARAQSSLPGPAAVGVLVSIRDASSAIRGCGDLEILPPTGPVPTCSRAQHCGAAPGRELTRTTMGAAGRPVHD